MKNIIKVITYSLLLIVAPVSLARNSFDGIVAVVNDDVITRIELAAQIKTFKQQLSKSGITLPSDDVFSKQVLDRLINTKIQLQLAKKMGVVVDNSHLNTAVRDIASRNNMSLSDMRHQIESHGLSYEEYRKNIRDEITLTELQQREIAHKIVVTDEQINEYFSTLKQKNLSENEYHLKNILIPLSEAPTPEQIKQAKLNGAAILEKLKEGADFSATAIAQSSGQQALEGGDLGWRSYAELPGTFSNSVKNMKPGEVSDLIRTANGFHIIKLVDKRNKAHASSISRNHVRELLFKQKMEEHLQTWVQQIRSESYIKIMM